MCLLLTGCVTYGDLTETTYNGPSSGQDSPDRFYMFYSSDQTNFDYELLGEIRTVSNRTDSDTEVLERMAYEAWSKGANAILFIETSTTERSEGTIDLLLDSDCEQEDLNSEIYYEALVLEGKAAYINVTDKFILEYGQGLDLFYVQKVEQDLERESRSKGAQAVLTLAGGVVSLMALILGSDNTSE